MIIFFEAIPDIGDVNCSTPVQISHESVVSGVITSIGIVEERCSCPKCYSTDVECNDKTIKCIRCKSRSLFIKQSIQQTKIKLNLNNVNRNMLEFIADTLKVQALLEQCGHQDLSRVDLIEQEDVLLALSSINVLVNFNPKNMHINTIVLNNVENN
ncbi:unnamed protein product [Rotaria magnacalcarata]|uniref:Uncharacterized protein n=1 Tax=Rotaria magnacalcarata TaxID=392030 RepID=A0A815Q536_9BILA|nr:unnamed protein product [Rotaria magnacalcarata]CAF5078266.1 unnamed protein product [Rotaria magnacalcarata]